MEDNTTTNPKIAKFWRNYAEMLKRFPIPAKSIPWYRRHIEAFISDHPHVRLKSHSAKSVVDWLEHIGKDSQINAWQYRQKVDSLRILFGHCLRLPWCSDFDWDRWLNSARALERNHATIARTYEMIEKSVDDPKNHLARSYPDLYRQFLVAIRLPDYSINTEKSYLDWINRFLRFHNHRHPCDCSESDVASFLEHLTLERKVSSATQSLALNAVVFFYARVLESPLGNIGPFSYSKRPKRIPTVLSIEEINSLLMRTKGFNQLILYLMYGTGMRVMECVRLRVLDLDFDYRNSVIRAGKGKKDRTVPMPDLLIKPLQAQIEHVKEQHDNDLKGGFGSVFLPDAPFRKYPNADKALRWQYLFPASRIAQDPRTGVLRRHHLHQSAVQKMVMH
jgi:integron integrase